MSTPERTVKNRVTALLKQYGAYYFFPMTGGFGRSGVPDIVACCKGKFVAIECKAGGNKPTPLQQRNIDQIQSAFGHALVIHENNLDTLRFVLDMIYGTEAKDQR